MAESILREKSYNFAKQIVFTCKEIIKDHKDYILTRQLMRSGTAIGALIREAEFAQSKPDFINKFSIALKEANESYYWISLMKDTDFLKHDRAEKLMEENNQLISMLVSSINTARNNLNKKNNHF